MTLIGTTLSLCLAISSPQAVPREASPADLVARFYREYLRFPHSGVPSATELAQIRPFLSDRLHGLFAAALRYQQDWIKRNPERPDRILKPPLVDGPEWFQSLAEWPDDVESLTGDTPASSFRIVGTRRRGRSTWHVRVRYSFATKPVIAWEDVFVVAREHGRIVIDDVIYCGKPFYYRGGRLSKYVSPPFE